MAPSHSRHLLVWTTLPIAVLLSYLWFKRKRTEVKSDPGRTRTEKKQEKSLEQEIKEADDEEVSKKKSPQQSSPKKIFSRSLSGVDSTPIDIIFPPEIKSAKSSQLIISDEDLDLEIEKIRSMKNSSIDSHSQRRELLQSGSVITTTPKSSKEATPKKETPQQRVTLKPTSPKKVASAKKKEQVVVAKTPGNSLAQENGTETEMAQKDVVTVDSIEKKINSLKIDGKDSNGACSQGASDVNGTSNVTENEIHRQSSERDSANHSPADVMLASPSLSSISDSHSEGSSDSGKGCSEVATPPSRTPAGDGSVSGDVTTPTIYEFIIPQTLVGRLIGRHGSFVSQIKNKAHAHIFIKKHPENNKLKICAIEGTQVEIDNALEMVRDKFPEKRYPDLTLEQVSFAPQISTVPLLPEQLYIKLVEGVNNDTIVSCMVAPNHLFLQQPTHPTFPNLNLLSGFMNMCYTGVNSPMLPNPMPENTVCAAFSLGAWYRSLVLSTDTETEISYVKFLDYGGYAHIKNSELRQIRADFLLLPFQAAECFLSNIRPVGGEDAQWPEEAFNLVADLTKGSIIYTQIAEYTEDGIPLVLIYVALEPQRVVFLNGELVNRGYAEWIVNEEPEIQDAPSA